RKRLGDIAPFRALEGEPGHQWQHGILGVIVAGDQRKNNRLAVAVLLLPTLASRGDLEADVRAGFPSGQTDQRLFERLGKLLIEFSQQPDRPGPDPGLWMIKQRYPIRFIER